MCSTSKALYIDLNEIILYAFEQENWTEKGNMDIFMMGTVKKV